MTNSASPTGDKTFLRKLRVSISLEWWFLVIGCFWAGVQSFAAWSEGARVAPLDLFDILGGSIVPLFAWAALVPLIIWELTKAREAMLRGLSPNSKVLVLFLAGAAFSAVYIEEQWFPNGIWKRMGEQHMLNQIGGPAAIAKDSAELLDKVERKIIPTNNDRVSVEQLTGFPALKTWKFARCTVNSSIPRVIYALNNHEGVTVIMQNGKWEVRRERFGGHVYWSDYVELNPQ